MSNIGRLRHRMQIQTYSETQDYQSGTIKTWTSIATVFAEIIPSHGYATFNAAQVENLVTHKIIIRYQPYITSENWLLMNSRRFRIRSIKNLLERNRFLELYCEEVFFAIDEFEVDVNTVEDHLRWPVDFGVAVCLCADVMNQDPSTYLLLTDKFVFWRN